MRYESYGYDTLIQTKLIKPLANDTEHGTFIEKQFLSSSLNIFHLFLVINYGVLCLLALALALRTHAVNNHVIFLRGFILVCSFLSFLNLC